VRPRIVVAGLERPSLGPDFLPFLFRLAGVVTLGPHHPVFEIRLVLQRDRRGPEQA
jgi:hypothetical protein